MEQEQQQQQSIFSFSFDETSKDHIKTISQWASINAILAFVGLAINIAGFIMASTRAYNYYTRPTLFDGFSAGTGFGLFVQVVVSVILNVFLYMASTQLRRGVQDLDNGSLTKGFGSLRNYYKMYGIVLIVCLILFVLYLIYMTSLR